MAPEIILGENYGLSCDIWSVGALMHKLLSFRTPFNDGDSREYKFRAVFEPLDLETNRFLR